MKLGDVLRTILIFVIFGALFFSQLFSVGLKKVKEEWPKNKCNPIYMPFAGYLGFDVTKNFQTCVANIMNSLMTRFLEPVLTSIKWVTGLAANILKTVTQIRSVLFNMKNQIMQIFKDIMSIFLNVLIKFQKITIKMKDLMMKMGGTMATVVYIANGFKMIGESIWNGPIGYVLKMANSLCFNPTTLVTMADGSKKMMKDIENGEKLKGGIEVSATLKIKNIDNEPYYKIYSKELKNHIYVTGSHLIQDPDTLRFIPVANSRHSVKTNIRDKQFSCLVTTTHTIPIGEYTFWDWED